ncbi:MAG TPA: FAD binding domain-containing protein [Acidimicrobiia bacterium]
MSIANVSAFLRPTDLETAFAAVTNGAIPVSGGTDVILHQPATPTSLVDLTALPMSGISPTDGAITIGATATLSQMLEHPGLAVAANGVIAEMLRAVGSPLLRNRATIGGHLARGRLSDVIPVLLALDAGVSWYDGTHRDGTLAEFYASATHRTRMIITAVTIPAPHRPSAAAFRRFSRTAFDLPILNCACRVDLADDGILIAAARVVVGETPALAASVADAELVLRGHPLVPSAIASAAAVAAAEIPARDDDRASAEYRRALAEVLVRRCLTEIGTRLP